MFSINGDADIEDVIQLKGLKCVCELCDCGRFHKHPGCKVKLPTIGATFEQEKCSKMESDYKARFQAYECPPTHLIRNGNELRRRHYQQPMDLYTTNQMSYQKFENPDVARPCKLDGQINQLLCGKFHDKTNYKDAFVDYKINTTKHARPSTVIKNTNGAEFSSESEYRKGFQKKEKIPQECFGERPSHTFAILHPDHSMLPQISLKNSVHDGRQCEKVRSCNMRKPNIDFGLNGEFDHTTTNALQFKNYDLSVPPLKRIGEQKTEEKCKFEGISQNQADYKYDEEEAKSARGRKITQPPSLIQLGMDMPDEFKTVCNLSYHKWKPENFKRPTSEFKPCSSYTTSNEKCNHHSHTHQDYVSYGAVSRTEIYHPPELRKSSAKVSCETSYNTCFQGLGKAERIYHGEYHSSNLKLPPADEKFIASSTMRNDYKPVKIDKRQSFKPTYKAYTGTERMSTATEYNQRFLPQQVKQCHFPKYLAAHEAAKVINKPEVTVS